ncbi:MAG TPA: TRAP transporter fused permease subunit, partial [Limnochordales bacterium]
MGLVAAAMSVYHLWAALAYLPAHPMRAIHLGFGLALIFLLYPARPGQARDRIPWYDVALAALGVAGTGYIVVNYREVAYRIVRPELPDLVWAAVVIVLVLEASRRTSGWALPVVGIASLAYGLFGHLLPGLWQHRGYPLERVLGQLYLSLEGIFGVPLGVSATFIVLFTLYGAVLDASGAGQFFVELSRATAGGHRASVGRSVVLASFLLGGPSGSGVATAVTVGAVAWPLLRRAGYRPETAGAVLAAGGIGAVISPPILGAASFIIAEILRVSYLEVIQYALIPTLLYYLSILLMIEMDAVRSGVRAVDVQAQPLGQLLRRRGYHLSSLVVIVIFLMMGFTATYAVLWSMAVAFALSFLSREDRLTPVKVYQALQSGARSVLNVVATTAVAGILVGVVNLTGLGLKFASIIVALAGGNLLATLVLAAVILLILGLALPITASYIVAAVTVAPALVKVGVPEAAAHMFIFYYSVLSEVSPPTALSCFAVSAITGGNPFRTMWITWRYSLPAFIVPFMFALHPGGMALLLKGQTWQVALATLTAAAGVAALAAGAGGWVRRETT